MKRVWDAVSRIFRSRIGNILALLNTSLLLLEFWQRGDFSFATVHPYMESVSLQVLLVINFPSLIFAGLLMLPLIFLVLGLKPDESNAVFQTLIFICTAGLQWQLIGYFIGRIVSKLVKRPAPLP